MKPSIGRIVHYQSYGTPGQEFKSAPRAAVITEVNLEPNPSGLIGICVLNPQGFFFNQNIPHAPNDVPTPGMWNWPPRVE